MDSLFFDANVSINDLLQEQLPVSRALTDEQILPSLVSVQEMFLEVVTGEGVLDALAEAARLPEEQRAAWQVKALKYARRAIANLALWFHFDELNVHITDQGFQRQEGESFKPLFRYQEIELKQQFKNKGFNALDALLDFLNSHLAEFPTFKDAVGYNNLKRSLVKGASEVELYCHINSSALVFMQLRPYIYKQMEIGLHNDIGSKVYDFLCQYLNGDFAVDTDEATLGETLRSKVAAVVILRALSAYVAGVGSVTDRGLYFESKKGDSQSEDQYQPSERKDRLMKARQFASEADAYLHRLLSWIENSMPDSFAGRPCDALNRCNENKRSFWA